MAPTIAPDLGTTFILPPTPSPTTPSNPRPRMHHRRPPPSFPPKTFYDLTASDFSHLASLFVDSRKVVLDAASVRERILRLPGHLQAHGLRRLSSLCSVHNYLAPAPVESLLGMLRAEAEGKVTRVWMPLVEKAKISSFKAELVTIALHLSVLWLGADDFRSKFGVDSRIQGLPRRERNCAACTLTAIGSSGLETLLALSAVVIGGIDEKWWGRSSRAMFCESWIRASAREGEGEQAVDLMFKVARAMGDARRRAEHGLGPLDEGGFEIVTSPNGKRKRNETVPARPKRISGGSEFVTELKTTSEAESELDDELPSDEEAFLRPGPARHPRVTSSIYSRTTNDVSTTAQLATPESEGPEEEDVIQLYRRSTIFPVDFHPSHILPLDIGKELPALPLTPPRSVIKRKPVPTRSPASSLASVNSVRDTSPAPSYQSSIKRKPVPAPLTPPQQAGPSQPSTAVPARKPLPSQVWANLGSPLTEARKRRKF